MNTKVEPENEVAVISDDSYLPTAQVIQMVERIAMNPEADIEKLERVMALQERMLDRDQEVIFNKALVAAQREMPVVETKSENKQTNSFYAKLDTINKAIVPVYTKHGFAVSFDTQDSPLPEHIRIVATLVHADGHSKDFRHDLPIDDKGIKGSVNKTQMHGRASTVSYGQRYLLCMIFNISTGTDVDGNRDQPNKITEEQALDLKAKIQEYTKPDWLETKVLESYGIESLNDLPANKLGEATSKVENQCKS